MRSTLILLIVMAVPSTLSAWQGAPEKVATVEGVTEYQFDNGARVLLFPDASRPTVTVNMTVLVGSRHEGYGEAGMAHLLEHMVFKGTPTHADIPRALRDHGASFNGTTNSDRTNYFETLPATDENLEFAIQMESDRLVNSYVKHEDLISEFTVVRNEFERGENSPQGVLSQRISSAAYEWHNYGKSTIGNRSDIERVPIDNLQAFYKKYYQPDNVVMVITGRFEEAKALELAAKHLGSIEKPERKLDPTYTEEPAQDGERLVELRRVGNIGSAAAAWHIPAASHEDWAPLSILASVISEDKVGLLEQKLIETSIATSVSARCGGSHDPGLFFVSVDPTEGNLENARDTMLETMDSLTNENFVSEAVERAKLRFKRQSENMMVNAESMAQALSSATSLGDWRLLYLQRDRIADVTVEDVKRVAQTYFPKHNRTVGTFIPSDAPQRMEIPAVASITDIVKDYTGGDATLAGEAFDSSPENLDARTENRELGGIKVALLPKSNRGETVNLNLTLRYGNEQSLAGQTTAAAMVASMLMAGTVELNRQALQERMTELDVQISGGGGGGGRGRRGGGGGGGSAGELSFSIEAKKESLNAGIELLGKILREPAFLQDEFEQMKARSINGMKTMITEPQMLATSELSRAMSSYPVGDVRYVKTLEETIAELEALTLEQITDIYENQMSAATGEISIVGDFDPDSAVAALETVLGDWKGGIAHNPIVRDASSEQTGATVNIKTPDKANAVFLAGCVIAMNEDDVDSDALTLANFIFGGGSLSSRLGDRVRQKEGLSYGVGSSISIPSEGNDSRFTINAITNPENIDAVETVVKEELNRFLKDGPTDEEVESARIAWLESRKLSRSSDGSIAGQLGNNLYLNRTFKYTAEREKRISELTVDDIKAAFARHIKVDQLVIVRAGDFKTE